MAPNQTLYSEANIQAVKDIIAIYSSITIGLLWRYIGRTTRLLKLDLYMEKTGSQSCPACVSVKNACSLCLITYVHGQDNFEYCYNQRSFMDIYGDSYQYGKSITMWNLFKIKRLFHKRARILQDKLDSYEKSLKL